MVVKNNEGMNNRRRSPQSDIHDWAAAKVRYVLKVSEQRAAAVNDTLYWIQDWHDWSEVLADSDFFVEELYDWDDDDEDDDWEDFLG